MVGGGCNANAVRRAWVAVGCGAVRTVRWCGAVQQTAALGEREREQ